MSALERAANDIVAAANELDARLSLLIDHARRDVRDVGAHRADGPVDESLLAVAYVGKHVAGRA